MVRKINLDNHWGEGEYNNQYKRRGMSYHLGLRKKILKNGALPRKRPLQNGIGKRCTVFARFNGGKENHTKTP